MSTLRHPFGKMIYEAVTLVTNAATITASAPARYLVDANTASGAITLTLAVDENMVPGDTIRIKVTQGATGRNVTFAGVSVDADALTGVASDTDVITLEYNGSSFEAVTGWVKTVDAA